MHPYTQALLAAVPEPDLDRPLDFAALMAGRGVATRRPGRDAVPLAATSSAADLVEVGARPSRHAIARHEAAMAPLA